MSQNCGLPDLYTVKTGNTSVPWGNHFRSAAFREGHQIEAPAPAAEQSGVSVDSRFQLLPPRYANGDLEWWWSVLGPPVSDS